MSGDIAPQSRGIVHVNSRPRWRSEPSQPPTQFIKQACLVLTLWSLTLLLFLRLKKRKFDSLLSLRSRDGYIITIFVRFRSDVQFSIDDFNTVGGKVPLIGNLKPHGKVYRR